MILDTQWLFLMFHQMIGGTPVCYQLRLRGKIDYEQLECSFNKVIMAHPAMRLKFHPPNKTAQFGEVSSTFEKSTKVIIEQHDLSHLSNSSQINLQYLDLLNRRNSIYKSSHFLIKIFKISSDEHVLLFEIDHLISDGLGNLLILHEWFSDYAKLSSPKAYSESEYCEIVTQINAYQPSEKKLKAFQLLMNQNKKASFCWNPEMKKPSSDGSKYRTVSRKLSKETTEKLIAFATANRVSFYSVIVNTYLEYFFHTSKEDRLIFTLPTGGRIYPEVDASEIVGCFAQALNLPVAREIMDLGLKERLQVIHEKIHSAVRDEIDHTQTGKMAQSIRRDFKLVDGELTTFGKALFRSSIKSNLYISYLGYSPFKHSYGSIEVIDYLEGTFNNSGVCDFVHTIFNDELHLFGNFDELFFDSSLIHGLMDSLVEWMESFEYSSSPEKQQVTSVNLDEKLIHYLMEAFEEIHHRRVLVSEFDSDLEAGLGLDSLGRIRLMTKIYKDFQNKLDFEKVFNCRTLHEVGQILPSEALLV